MKTVLFVLCAFASILTFAQIPSYIPQNGLMSYWPFSGNTDDASPFASHLTNNGAVLTTDRYGNPNSAYSFNGIDQSMIRTNPSWTFSATGSFTVSVWTLKPTTASGIVLINASTAANNFIWYLQGGINMAFGTNKQQSAWINLSTPLTVNAWEHYVCVYNAGIMSYYKNNVLTGTTNFTHTAVTSANLPLYVGQGISGGFINAKIDDIAVWNRALTPCEIGDIFTETKTLVNVNAGADTTICQGQSITLNATGTVNYLWNQGVSNGISFKPNTTTSYIVAGTDAAGCSGLDTVIVTVNPISIDAGTNQTVCAGGLVTLSATGGVSYVWNNGVTNGVPFVPTNAGIYTVIGSAANGCTRADSLTININPLPPVNAGNDTTICAGESITLVGSGGIFLSWNNGVFNNIAFTPTATASYVLSGSASISTCTNKDTIVVTVNQPSDSMLTINALDQYSLNGTVYTSSGTYTQTLSNTAGCDSVITLILDLDFTSLEEMSNSLIAWYPNPTIDRLTIVANSDLNKSQVSVYSANGELVKVALLHEGVNELDVQDLPTGQYFCVFLAKEKANFRWVKK